MTQLNPVRRLFICGSPDCRADVANVRDFVLSNPLLNHWFTPIVPANDGEFPDTSEAGKPEGDVFVFILGDRYDALDSGQESPIERLFDRTHSAGRATLVYVHGGENASERQRRFLRKVDARVTRKRFDDCGDLRMNVFASLGEVVTNGVSQNHIGTCHSMISFGGSVRNGSARPPRREEVVDQMAHRQEGLRKYIDPQDEGLTFGLGITLDALDVDKLSRVIEPENRFLASHGFAPLSVEEFLVRHRYADQNGRIYDVAFFMFGKTSFSYDGAVWATPRSAYKKKRVRAADGELTQADVATDFGVDRKTIIRWEREQTEDGPCNTSNPYGYYQRLRIDPNLRRAYGELVTAVRSFLAEKEKARQSGRRFRVTFERFNEHYARHNARH